MTRHGSRLELWRVGSGVDEGVSSKKPLLRPGSASWNLLGISCRGLGGWLRRLQSREALLGWGGGTLLKTKPFPIPSRSNSKSAHATSNPHPAQPCRTLAPQGREPHHREHPQASRFLTHFLNFSNNKITFFKISKFNVKQVYSKNAS